MKFILTRHALFTASYARRCRLIAEQLEIVKIIYVDTFDYFCVSQVKVEELKQSWSTCLLENKARWKQQAANGQSSYNLIWRLM